MQNLEDKVKEVIAEFMKNDTLFTALDVSNKIKESMPMTRHREVKDIVNNIFTSDMSQIGWTRTPIEVSLEDGSKVQALLYHALIDSWDIDAKYGTAQRAALSKKSNAFTVPTVAPPNMPPVMKPAPMPKIVSADPVKVNDTQASYARALWEQLFNSQPSLFPRKS